MHDLSKSQWYFESVLEKTCGVPLKFKLQEKESLCIEKSQIQRNS